MKAIPDDFQINGLVEGDELNKAAKSRGKLYERTRTVSKDKFEELEKEGWSKFVSASKVARGSVKVAKYKPSSVVFEDEVWSIFYKMGFTEMNVKSNTFVIPRYNNGVEKQIDVYARSGNTICIVECKSAENPNTSSSKANIRSAISGIIEMRQHINNSIYKHYSNQGNTDRYTILWILALKNIYLTENDRSMVDNENIIVIDTDLINYYKQLSDDFRASAQYLFLGDLMPNREIPGLTGNPIPAIRGKMGGQIFYSFLIEPERLLKISYLAHHGKSNAETLETYQRMAKRSRLNKIAQYIQEKPGGIFPTSIVININSESKSFKFESGKDMKAENAVLGNLYLPTRYHSTWIIDGQHRLYAYSGLEEAKTATLPVIAFVDLPASYQKKLFVDINGEQKSVPKNLLISLYAALKKNSPLASERLKAMSSTIILSLNEDEKSVFYHQIADGNGNVGKILTMTNLSDELNYTKLLGSVPKTTADKGIIIPGPLYRNNYDDTCKHAKEVICEYYNVFRKNEAIQTQWALGDDGYINSNTGIRSTLRLLGYILDHLKNQGIEVSYRDAKKLMVDIEPYLLPVIEFLENAPESKLNELRRLSGKAGITTNTHNFVMIINKKYPDFQRKIAESYEKEYTEFDEMKNQKAYGIGSKLERQINSYVIVILKNHFGTNIGDWWGHGVPLKIQQEAAKLAVEKGDYSQNYAEQLNLIHLKQIISENWDLFDDVFTIDARPNDRKETRLKWFNDFNKIRNRYSHVNGVITDEDITFLEKISAEFNGNISKLKLYHDIDS